MSNFIDEVVQEELDRLQYEVQCEMDKEILNEIKNKILSNKK